MSLWTWSKQPDFEKSLLYLRDNFKDSYEQSIKKHSQHKFVTVYGSQKIEKNFAEFHQDVLATIEVLPKSPIVAISSLNSYPMLVYVAAAILNGQTVSLLNPHDDEARRKNKLKQLGPNASICFPKEISQAKTPNKLQGLKPDQSVFLIFTSGSTGYSKLVQQSEMSLLSNIDALIDRHNLKPGVCVGTPLPVFHVNALGFSFLSCLLSGAHLVLFANYNLSDILKAIESEKINILSLIPDFLRNIAIHSQQFAKYNTESLKYFVSAAAPLSVDTVKQLHEKLKLRVIQGYGLSEAINFSVLLPTTLSDQEYQHWMTEYQRPSIGTAVRGNDVFILDSQGNPASEGQEGEVAIRGFNVMKGYSDTDNSKVFKGDYLRTGDLGFFKTSATNEKFYFISGRLKDVIKRHGETISLAEVDDILAQFSKHEFQCISVGFSSQHTGEEVGLVVNNPMSDVEQTELSLFISNKLPEYMRPKVVYMTKEPLKTASGKPLRWKFTEKFQAFSASKLSNKSPIFFA